MHRGYMVLIIPPAQVLKQQQSKMTSETSNQAGTLFAVCAPTSILPVELWLHILERASIYEASHLWTAVRHVSRKFKDLVERVFASIYLPMFAITLSLPRRDPTSGALLWPGAPIPRAQLSMSFDGLNADESFALFRSPSVLKEGTNATSVEELKNTSVLPLERLQAATAWVHFTRNQLTGIAMRVPGYLSWDEERKTWVWSVKWKDLMTQFYASRKQKSSVQVQPSKGVTGRTRFSNNCT
jgi:hypothetical protein